MAAPGDRPGEVLAVGVDAVGRRDDHVERSGGRGRTRDRASRSVHEDAGRQSACRITQGVAVRVGGRELQRHRRAGLAGLGARVREHRRDGGVDHRCDRYPYELRDRRGAGGVQHEQQVEPGRRVGRAGRRLRDQPVAGLLEGEFDEPLLEVEAVRGRRRLDQRDATDRGRAAKVATRRSRRRRSWSVRRR